MALGGSACGEDGDPYCWPHVARGGVVPEEHLRHPPEEAFSHLDTPPPHMCTESQAIVATSETTLAVQGQLTSSPQKAAPAAQTPSAAGQRPRSPLVRRARKATARLTGTRHFFGSKTAIENAATTDDRTGGETPQRIVVRGVTSPSSPQGIVVRGVVTSPSSPSSAAVSSPRSFRGKSGARLRWASWVAVVLCVVGCYCALFRQRHAGAVAQ